MSKSIEQITRETIVEVIRNLARTAEKTPHGTLHYTTIAGIADDLEKLGLPVVEEVSS